MLNHDFFCGTEKKLINVVDECGLSGFTTHFLFCSARFVWYPSNAFWYFLSTNESNGSCVRNRSQHIYYFYWMYVCVNVCGKMRCFGHMRVSLRIRISKCLISKAFFFHIGTKYTTERKNEREMQTKYFDRFHKCMAHQWLRSVAFSLSLLLSTFTLCFPIIFSLLIHALYVLVFFNVFVFIQANGMRSLVVVKKLGTLIR